jgi:hypothetical protein
MSFADGAGNPPGFTPSFQSREGGGFGYGPWPFEGLA